MNIEVCTQAELDKALKKITSYDVIVLEGKGTFVLRESSSPTVVARGSSSPMVVARGSSSPRVVARESSSPTVEAWESSSPRVEARESSSPRVVAWGSSSPTVEARESSSPRVEAWDSSSPRGSVGKYAALVASQNDRSKITIPGAVLLEQPKIETAADWCDYYGVAVKRGMALLFKAVDDDYSTGFARSREVFYTPGSKPKAPDWDGGRAECGGGLHFSPSPSLGRDFNPDATRYVACPVKLSEIVVHKNPSYPNKVKAPRVAGAIYEVDVDGERLKKAKAA
jgi:hypothetical protein